MPTGAASFVVMVLSCAAVAMHTLVAGSAPGEASNSPVGPPDSAACDVGGAPTYSYGEEAPESFLRYGTRPIVIGCATLASGRRFELVGYQLGTRERTRLCIDHYDLESNVGWGCGSNMVAGGWAIGSTSTARLRGKPDVVSATVSERVRRVVVRSEIRGRLRRHAASTVLVRGRELLRAIGVRKPFGRLLSEVPSDARAVTAEAFGRRRRSLGLVFFPGFRHPLGEGRACYGRPRIADMRLLEPPRGGKRNRLQVIASYPRGYVSSLEAAVAGTPNDRVDFARPHDLTGANRRVATLRLRFPRRRTVLVDAVAEGRPLSPRCGAGPALRQSTMRTLVVRLR